MHARGQLWILVVAVGLSFPPPSAAAQWVPDGVALCTAANDQLSPRSCSDGMGGSIVVWADARSSSYAFDIYAQRVNFFGQPQWAAGGVAICTASGNQLAPAIASDGAGGAIIAWEDHRSPNANIYAQHVSVAGAVQWTADGVQICAALGNQFAPRIVPDDAGGAIIAWEDFRTHTNYDIYARRVNAAGVPQWAANGVALCTTSDDQFAPRIARDGAGGAIVTWYDSRGLNPFEIYAQRVDSGGVVQWTGDGIAVCAAVNTQEEPEIAADGSGGAIVTWLDYRANGFNSDIYAQRVNAAGAPQWVADGVPLCAADGDQTVPSIAADGLGGAVVAWDDSRASRPQVYAQRVNSAGVTRWASNGLALSVLPGDQLNPAIASASKGGAIVAWSDARKSTFNADLYAQRVDSAGVAQWAANGLAICSAGSDQASPTLVPDTGGGAVIAWEDGRSGSASDIYAQRVTASGVVGPTTAVPDATSVGFALAAPRPNPSRAGATLAITLPFPQRVTADVFGVDGRRVRSLAQREPLAAGVHALAWDGRDETGARAGTGLYLVRVRAESGSGTVKVTLVR